MSDSSRPHALQPSRLLHPWALPGKSTGVGCHRYSCCYYYCQQYPFSSIEKMAQLQCWDTDRNRHRNQINCAQHSKERSPLHLCFSARLCKSVSQGKHENFSIWPGSCLIHEAFPDLLKNSCCLRKFKGL